MRSMYRCARCGRPIKLGKEKFFDGRPYGSFCFDKEIAWQEFLSRNKKDSKEKKDL